MYASLMPELLSIHADLPRAIALAARHGFGGVDTQANHLTSPELDLDRVAYAMTAHNLRPGYFSLPLGRVPAAEAEWEKALASLPHVAVNAQRLGFERAALVVLPFHETLPFEAAFEEHVRRIDSLTNVLDDFGIALALEYVAPLSRRAAYTHPFVYDMRGMLALCEALASPQVGLLLDSFHWHCAGEDESAIACLPAERVVVVHINDAPNRPMEEQTVGDRNLPGATGVIDLPGFVGALQSIGYDGPVTCEPMAKAIAALPSQDENSLLERVSIALQKTLWAEK